MKCKLFKISVVVLVLVALAFPVYANASPSGAMTPPPPAQDEVIAPLATQYLTSWSCFIINNGDGTVSLTGYSQANQFVDQIWVSLYLQRWDGSNWVTVSSGYKTTVYNSDYAEGAQRLSVTRGYYYRTMAKHQVIHNGVNDPSSPASSYSTSVLVN